MADLTTEQIEKVITDSLISFGANAEDINRDAELAALRSAPPSPVNQTSPVAGAATAPATATPSSIRPILTVK